MLERATTSTNGLQGEPTVRDAQQPLQHQQGDYGNIPSQRHTSILAKMREATVARVLVYIREA